MIGQRESQTKLQIKSTRVKKNGNGLTIRISLLFVLTHVSLVELTTHVPVEGYIFRAQHFCRPIYLKKGSGHESFAVGTHRSQIYEFEKTSTKTFVATIAPWRKEDRFRGATHLDFASSPNIGQGGLSPPTASVDEAYIEPTDGDALQALFVMHCDEDGLMTLTTLKAKIPQIRVLLEDGDLLDDELSDIWNAAPKFPTPVNPEDDEEDVDERIDVDGFVKIYRDVDDLFEDDDDENELASKFDVANDVAESHVMSAGSVALNGETQNNTLGAKDADIAVETRLAVEEAGNEATVSNKDNEESEEQNDQDERELEHVFFNLCNSDKLLSKQSLRDWEEVDQLVRDNLLSELEFDSLWERTLCKHVSGGGEELLDVDGFLSFNVALDDLFVLEDTETEVRTDETGATVEENNNEIDVGRGDKEEATIVTGDSLSPDEIFSSIANDDFLVGLGELKERWGDLKEMLADGDLMPLELENMYATTPKAPGAPNKIDLEGFKSLYQSIDDLFEDDVEVDDDEVDDGGFAGEQRFIPDAANDGSMSVRMPAIKADLLDILAALDQVGFDRTLEDQDMKLPCGLECGEKEQAEVLDAVSTLEKDRSCNQILQAGVVTEEDLAGEWELLYTSSSMMKFNQGLSGLGGTFPNGRFGGLKQKIQASRYLTDVEYIERIVVNPEISSFDVRITGDWELKQSVSLLTGEPTIIMSVEPDKVVYGPTTTRADHWKSVRAMNLLDVTYLDDDLRIMRGNTSTDTIFVFKRL